jgi:hypothetical protein
MLLDLSRGLDVSPEGLETCLLCQAGDRLKPGDLIAQSEGRLTRVIRSPMEGRLVDISRGRALLASETETLRVIAGMVGFVEDVFPDYGVLLRSEGSLLQGVWGNGGAGVGTLRIGETPDSLELDCEPDDVLALNIVSNASILQQAVTLGSAGLIVGCLAPELIPDALRLNQPVIVLQALGEQEPDTLIWDMLSARAGSLVSVNAAPTDRRVGQRPEVILPTDQGELQPALGFQAVLQAGSRVRILTGDYRGKNGNCIAFEKEHAFPGGWQGPSAIVKLVDGTLVQVPQQNLVILG